MYSIHSFLVPYFLRQESQIKSVVAPLIYIWCYDSLAFLCLLFYVYSCAHIVHAHKWKCFIMYSRVEVVDLAWRLFIWMGLFEIYELMMDNGIDSGQLFGNMICWYVPHDLHISCSLKSASANATHLFSFREQLNTGWLHIKYFKHIHWVET